MPNGFRVTGTWYLSKSGLAAGTGTKDSPFPAEQLSKAFPGPGFVVLGAGVYRYTYVGWVTNYSNGRLLLAADGIVKVLGMGAGVQTLGFYAMSGTDIYFDQFQTIAWRASVAGGDGAILTRCIIKVMPSASVSNVLSQTGGSQYTDCVLFNFNTGGNAAAGDTFTRCIFINCQINAAANVTSCYIDPTSGVKSTAASNNNVDPGCDTAQGYGLNVNGAGFSLVSPSGISAAPLFNSVTKEDFTLRAASPHIIKGIGPSHYRYANSYYIEFMGAANEEASLSNLHLRATGTNTVVPLLNITDGTQGFEVNNQGGLVLLAMDTSTGFGDFVTGRIAFSDIADEMTVMLLKAGLNFDTAYPALESQFNYNQPEIYNNNVPDYSSYAPSSAGRNPNRLSYRMRWSTKANPNADLANVADWVTGTNFVEFEWNQKPLWNPATGIGNGDASFDAATGQPIQCTFYQLQVRLRNNYYH